MSGSLEHFYHYWGKAEKDGRGFHLLAYHCLDVAAVGKKMLEIRPELITRLGDALGIERESLLNLSAFLVALHDTGKFSDGFQALRKDLIIYLQVKSGQALYSNRHDTQGYHFCKEYLADALLGADTSLRDKRGLVRLLDPWLSAVTGHHGTPPLLDFTRTQLHMQFPSHAKEDALEFVRRVALMMGVQKILLQHAGSDDKVEQMRRTSWLLAGVTVAADWVGSNRDWFRYHTEEMPLEEYWTDFALSQAEEALIKSGLVPPLRSITVAGGMRELFPGITDPTPLQVLTDRMEVPAGPQLFIIEEVTGGGKTEAAITIAQRLMSYGLAEGVYFALPTMATANAMYDRIGLIYKDLFADGETPTLMLAHSARDMRLRLEDTSQDKCEASCDKLDSSTERAAWLFDHRKKALLADVGVGTIDQALMGVLPVRHQSLRLLGLARKVLIIDEAHACDSYVNMLLQKLLRHHASLGGSAILLSATLPSITRQEFSSAFSKGAGLGYSTVSRDDYPLVTHIYHGGIREMPVEARRGASREVSVTPLHSEDELSEVLHDALRAGGCACWIRNTVHDALTAYRRWSAMLGKENVMLFHARYALGDRLDIEAKVLNLFGQSSFADDRKGKLLIATQVVEQSLDLDFDFMVTDLAPIDLVIQRAGRLRRHKRDRSGGISLGVFMPEPSESADADWYSSLFPKAAQVYGHHGQLWLTARWLADKKAFRMPEDARGMIETVYGDASTYDVPPSLDTAEIKAYGEDRAGASSALLNALNMELGYEASSGKWEDDVSTPTRLGERMADITLARWEDGRVVPWSRNEGRRAWELSRVSVRRHYVDAECIDLPQDTLNAVEAARKTMPGRGRYKLLIPLELLDGVWTGNAMNNRGEKVTILYDETTGLDFKKEDG